MEFESTTATTVTRWSWMGHNSWGSLGETNLKVWNIRVRRGYKSVFVEGGGVKKEG